MDGDFKVKEDKKDELLHLIADETAKRLLGDKEEIEPDGIAEELEKEVENFMDRITGMIRGEEK